MSVYESTMTVRQAETKDLLVCAEWLLMLRPHTHWRHVPAPSMVELGVWLVTRGCLFVAESEDGRIVGMCGGSMGTHELFPAVPYVTEEPFYVEPSWRHGIAGRLLLTALKAWAIEQGACALLLGRPSHHGEVLRWHPLGVSHD